MSDLLGRMAEWWEYDTGLLMAEARGEITLLRARLDAVEKERDRLAEINRNLSLSHNDLLVDGSNLQRRAERAEAALATARRDALEGAAKVCQRISNTDLAATNPPYEEGYSDAADACFHAIRALISQEDGSHE